MAFLLTAGIGTIYARNEAEQGIADVEQGLQAAVDAEAWMLAHEPQLSAEMLVDAATSSHVEWMMANERHLLAAVTGEDAPATHLAVGDTRFAGRYAAVEITLQLADMREEGHDYGTYRQTRFYRETTQGWLRTQPVPALWGQLRSIDTRHLTWRYRASDEDAVLAVAERMDALYEQMRLDYGLGQKTADDDRLTVYVQVDHLPGRVPLQKRPMTEVDVPSPAVHLVPQHYADEDVLAQTVTVALLRSLAAQAAEVHSLPESDTVLAGLQLWELRALEQGLSASTWRSIIGPTEKQGLHEVCAEYAVWMLRPMAAGLPVRCEGVRAESLSYRIERLASLSLRDVGWQDGGTRVGHTSVWLVPQAASLFMATVIDYAGTAHGRESVPRLLAALGEHESWETLVPAVYGISLAEFEAGWRQHLAQIAL
jgi:hypothetical protein